MENEQVLVLCGGHENKSSHPKTGHNVGVTADIVSTALQHMEPSITERAAMLTARAANIAAWTGFIGVVAAAGISGWFLWKQKEAELAYTRAAREADLQHQNLVLAVGLLSKDRGKTGFTEEQKAMRKWAVKLLNMSLTPDARVDQELAAALIDGGAKLPAVRLVVHEVPGTRSRFGNGTTDTVSAYGPGNVVVPGIEIQWGTSDDAAAPSASAAASKPR